MKRNAIGGIIAIVIVGLVVLMTIAKSPQQEATGLGGGGDAAAPEIDVDVEQGAAGQ